ncbi:hypothetical protein NC651_038006 [Populus alba x Populus x berolinensis]|nr:hypothetical protein NC651_038006 [Populus alba x Populus x berolinensis]
MASTTLSPISLTFILYVFIVLLCPLCSLKKGLTVEGKETTNKYFRTVKVNSLLPSNVCSQSPRVLNRAASLKVVNRYGPCIPVTGAPETINVPSTAEFLLQDQLRVKSFQVRLSRNPSSGVFKEMQTTIPASILPTGGAYVVTVGLGTPKKDFTVLFDTGSDLTWTQCEPCLGGCFPQDQPKFDPTTSTSYKNVSCSSEFCKLIAEEAAHGCNSNTCIYGIQYGSGSTFGFLATETLTIASSDVFENFLFGCGEQNEGTFNGTTGLLGLGRSPIALPSQTTNKYKNLFSYCLPASPSSTGHLSFGVEVSQAANFTPISPELKEVYGLNTVGISVGGRKLPINGSISPTLIDSGTTFTYLPSSTYSALASAFQEMMANYTLTNGTSGFQPCYDFSNIGNGTLTIPGISIFFEGGVEVEIDVSGIMIPVNGMKEVCLAFADTGSDSDFAIFGNYQQKTYEVIYDVAKGMVGFAPKGC